jgi:glycosyltransferase involved in cell wall biosynthesis
MPDVSGSGRRHVLFLGGYDSTKVSRIRAIAEGLSRHDFLVTEYNAPLRFPHAARVGLVRRPWMAFSFVLALVRSWLRLARSARGTPPPDLVLVPYPAQFDVLLARLLFPRTRLAADLMVFLADTVRDRRGLELVARTAGLFDRLAMHTSDIILLDTEEHRQLVPRRHQHKCVVVPVGATAEWFVRGDPPGARATGTTASIVFFGLFTPLQGTATIATALCTLARRGVPFTATVVGNGQDAPAFDRLVDGLGNIRRIDWLDEPGLRQEVGRHDICLGIFGTTPKALRVVPQKVALGAASGCALVTSDTDPQRRLLGGTARLVPPGDPAALADELERLLKDPQALQQLRIAASALARERFAPEAIVTALVGKLGGMQ